MQAPDAVVAQLATPDPIGVDLALFRTRVYRFSDDLCLYVLAELLEERFIAGRDLRPATIDYVRACLEQIRRNGHVPDIDPTITEAEGIDVDAEIQARTTATEARDTGRPRSDQVVFIVGAPRSGTSHLYNLLAYTGTFSYFTNVSCWRWPTWNLSRPGRRSFEDLDHRFFDVDNRATRLVPALVVPYEAEDLYARAFPVYRHLHGHTYDLGVTGEPDPRLVERSAIHHTAHFDRQTLLTKSPFNSLRIPDLEHQWAERARYIHIVRNATDVARSMEQNRFRFLKGQRHLTGEEAAHLFTDAVMTNAPTDRLLTVQFDDLQTDPAAALAHITIWLRM